MLRAVIHLIHRELLMALASADIQPALVLPHRHHPVSGPGSGPDPSCSARSGIIWVAAHAGSHALPGQLFRDDFQRRRLEQMMLMPHPSGLLAWPK